MFVVLESLEELIIFGKGLASSCCFRHVVAALFHLFTPKCDRLLPFVADIRLYQLFQFFIACYLTSIFEAERLSEIFVNVGEVDSVSALIVHDKSAYMILI